MRHDCGAEAQERRLAKIEADWMAAPEDAELLDTMELKGREGTPCNGPMHS